MAHFYIMNAVCLFDDKAASLEEAKNAWGNDITVIVARRHTGAKIFICGSGTGCYDVKAGDDAWYTQDTGQGYRNIDKPLKIENVTAFDREGKMVRKDNDIGFNEKRNHWTMK